MKTCFFRTYQTTCIPSHTMKTTSKVLSEHTQSFIIQDCYITLVRVYKTEFQFAFVGKITWSYIFEATNCPISTCPAKKNNSCMLHMPMFFFYCVSNEFMKLHSLKNLL